MFGAFRQALRSLLKTPGFTAVAVLTMAIAIGACTTVFSVLEAVVLRPLPYPNASALYNVWSVAAGQRAELPQISYVKYEMLREQHDVFADVAVAANTLLTYRNGNADPEMVMAKRVSPNVLSLLGVTPALGRGFSAQDDQEGAAPVAMISHALWRSRFGADSNVVGRTILVDEKPREIIGVMPAAMAVAFKDIDIIVPHPTSMPTVPVEVMRLGSFYNVTARLAPGVSAETANARVSELARRYLEQNPQERDRTTNVLRPMKRDLVGDAGRTFWILAAAVGAVLLIACANIANLFLARVSTAWRDVAVRFSLGAGRGTILRQFFLESAVFSLGGAALGVLLAWLSLRGVIALAGNYLPRASEVRLDTSALVFSLAVSLFSALLVCLYPAWLAARTDVQSGLKETGRGAAAGGAGRVFREGLVVVQVSLSLALLSCAALLAFSLYRLLSADLGFATEGRAVGFVNLPSGKYATTESSKAFYRALETALQQAPELAAAGAVSGMPLSGAGYSAAFNVVGRPPASGEPPLVSMRWATPGYLAAVGGRLREGRFFTPADRADAEQVVVLNETLANIAFPHESAVDKRIGMGEGSSIRVAGVIRDLKTDIAGPVINELYVARDQMPINVPGMSVVARGKPGLSGEAIIPVIRRVLKQVDPSLALHWPRTLTALVDESVQLRRLAMTLLLALAGIAALLAAVGLYAVLAYTVAQRTPEIGVRMALGAQRKQIVRLILSQGMRLVALGLVLGLIGVIWATRLLRSMLYQVQPLDPAILATTVLLFASIAAVACLVPSLRAAKLDPLEALRSE